MAENIVYNPQAIAKVFQIWVVGYGMYEKLWTFQKKYHPEYPDI